MSSFNEATGLGCLKNEAIEFVKYPCRKVILSFIMINDDNAWISTSAIYSLKKIKGFIRMAKLDARPVLWRWSHEPIS